MEVPLTVEVLGTMARAARLARGWTQQEAADAAGVSRRFVNLFEGGQHRNAEVWRVLALLGALGVRMGVEVPDVRADLAHSGPSAQEQGAPEEEVQGEAARDDRARDERAAGLPADGSPPPSVPAPDGFDLDAHLSSFRGAEDRP